MRKFYFLKENFTKKKEEFAEIKRKENKRQGNNGKKTKIRNLKKNKFLSFFRVFRGLKLSFRIKDPKTSIF